MTNLRIILLWFDKLTMTIKKCVILSLLKGVLIFLFDFLFYLCYIYSIIYKIYKYERR